MEKNLLLQPSLIERPDKPFRSHCLFVSGSLTRTLKLMNTLLCLTDLRDGQDQERSSAAGLNDDRQELWVDGAEGAVPRHLGDPDVIVALLRLDVLAKDVAKLALPHDAATHG